MNATQRPYRLRLMTTYRNLFYTPIYAAVAGGFLYAEGLDVMFGNVPSDRSAVDMLRRAEVDIVQTGISRSMMALDAGESDAPLHIAEINRGDGLFAAAAAIEADMRQLDIPIARIDYEGRILA